VVDRPKARFIPEADHSHHSPPNFSLNKCFPSVENRTITRSIQEMEAGQTHFSASFPTRSLPAVTDQIPSGSITAAAGLVGREGVRQGKGACIKSVCIVFDNPLPRDPPKFEFDMSTLPPVVRACATIPFEYLSGEDDWLVRRLAFHFRADPSYVLLVEFTWTNRNRGFK